MNQTSDSLTFGDDAPNVLVTIVNKRGLHARAAAKFVQTSATFEAQVGVTRNGQTVSGSSIMGLMMLAAAPGTEIHIAADGRQASDAIDALKALVEDGFGEDD